MATTSNTAQEQQHPQYASDRQITNTLLKGEADDFNLAECARLRIRYQDFPGATDIHTDLDTVLKNWGLTEDELFARTRHIHRETEVYKNVRARREDWS
ncbi:MAG: DUF3288 family protein [Merismopedia sp. SIO2A8]|nr:DUF3288 family protein [Merismopedia sp. SIO2A8]